MSVHLRHPLLDGTLLGVALSFVAAAGVGWLVAYRLFGPSRHPRVRHVRTVP